MSVKGTKASGQKPAVGRASLDDRAPTAASAAPAGGALPLGVPRVWRASAGAIGLDRAEMLRYLGYQGQDIEPELAARIDAAASEAERLATPSGAWSVFGIAPAHPAAERAEPGEARMGLEDPISGLRALELSGHDIYRHLKGARYAAVLACTIGMATEQRLRVLGSQDPLEGAVFDAACSALVEAAADALNREVEGAAADASLACNWRFSPGYGDLPLDLQSSILAVLNASRLCGITATPSNLLMPTKSITAFIGLFEGEPHASDTARSCTGCRMTTGCPFRARNMRCWVA